MTAITSNTLGVNVFTAPGKAMVGPGVYKSIFAGGGS
jgi:hypothetical protein